LLIGNKVLTDDIICGIIQMVRSNKRDEMKEDTESKIKSSIISLEKTKSYTTHNILTASGKRKSIDNGDFVSGILRGMGTKDYNEIYDENKFLVSNWNTLNAGLKRLALGNIIRKRVRFNLVTFIKGKKLEKIEG